MLERGFSTGSGYDAKLFEMSTVGATDVRNVDSLACADVTPARKRLLVDFDDLPLPGIDDFWPGENNRFVALAIGLTPPRRGMSTGRSRLRRTGDTAGQRRRQ